MLTRFRKISYLMAYTVATIPLWHYVSESHILLLMTAVIIFAYLNVVLSSVEAAQAILSSEKAKTPLPRWLPKKPKYEKWWLIVHHTLKWHLFLVPAKMGLALGLVEKLYNSWIAGIPFSQAYVYNDWMVHSYFPILYPQIETVIISLSVILIFTICETFLLASIALITKSLKQFIQKSAFVFLTRLSMILLFVGLGVVVINPIESLIVPSRYLCLPTLVFENGEPVYEDKEHRVYRAEIQESGCILKRLIDTAYLSLITPYDQGILLAANIMRPWGQITYAELGSQRTNGNKNIWDNRLFVLRQCLAGILGIFLYLGTTWAILYFVEDEPHLKPL